MAPLTFAQLKAIGFVCVPQRIDDLDIPRIGHMIGVGEDEVHALIDVEASGSGFDSSSRPKILYEPHVMYRNTSGDIRALLVAKGLAYPNWKPGAYPKDSYPRFLQAMALHETAAIKACSWGLGQILGENYKDAGYDTPQDMVAAFCADEAEHLEAMIRFIKANKLDDELRAHNWAAFARGYNGPRYAENNYHTKLAQRFAWWQTKRDTPWTPGMDEPIVIQPTPEPPQPVPVPVPVPAPLPTPEPAPQASADDLLWDMYVKAALHFGHPAPVRGKPMAIGQRQNFVGGLIGSVLTSVVVDAVGKVAKDVGSRLEPDAAPSIAAEIAVSAQVDPRIKDLEARLQHITNTEPDSKSRVNLGAWGAILAGAAALFGLELAPEEIERYVVLGAGAVSTLSGALAWWGRNRSKKPLFS